LFAGPKRAGKTTTLLHLVASTGAAIVANDRVVVSESAGQWRTIGVPTIVSVRADTLARLPGLFATIPNVEWPARLTLEEAQSEPMTSGREWSTPELFVSLAQVAAALGVPLSAGGALRCVAFLVVDADVDFFTVRDLNVVQAATRFDAVRFGATTQPRGPTVFETFLGPSSVAHAADTADTACQLPADVRCAELRVGSRFLESATAAEDVLHALSERA
jgi:hypothetical protein